MSKEFDDDPRPPIDGYREPPPFPADSLWAGIEARMAGERQGMGAEGSGRRAVQLPVYWAAAAALALFAGGAAVGTLLSPPGGAGGMGDGPAGAGSQIVPASVEPASPDTRNVVWL